MKVVLLSLALIGAVAASAQAQDPRGAATVSAGAVVIAGRVVTDSTGDPIRNARVTLSPDSPHTPVVLTDAAGAFRLTAPGMSVGRYSVVASKTGYARADATPAVAGQPVEVRLKKGAAIVGRVVDERGDPVVGVQVAAPKQPGAGNKPTTVATTDTDDRGEYRLAGLSDGTFVVGVTTLAAVGRSSNPSANSADRRTTYYPGTAVLGEAQPLHLQPGEERRGTDIVVPADRLAGTPAALFANRFLPRPELPGRIRPGVQNATPRPTGSVRGRVVSIDGTPISLAQVYLFASTNSDSKMATTDEEGRFEFGAVAAGRLLVSVTKSGYTQVESGQAVKLFPMGRAVTSPTPNDVQFGRRLELAAGEIKEGVDLQMARWSTLSGTVADEYGDPIQGVGVEVLRVRYEAGRQRLASAGESRVTDDLGRYRLHGLAAGQYIVSAAVGQVSSEDLPGYARSYFPGTPNPGEAQYVSVGLAQDADAIDFSMSRARTARVAGIVLGPTGEPTLPGALTLAPSQRSSSVTNVAVGARIAPDGTFVFPNVPPGQYVIQAYRGRLNSHTEGEFGALPVTVNGTDITDLRLQTSSGSSVTGRVTFDALDPTTTPKPSDVELAPIPADFDLSPPNNPASAEIHADWTFEIAGLNGPRRLQILRAPPGWALKEIRMNGIDVIDRPLSLGRRDQWLANVEVVMTDRVTELSGTITDDRARRVPGATLVVFSTDRDRWYPASRHFRRAAAGPDGAFTVAGLPSGSYYASAAARIPTDEEDAWQDPQFLESLVLHASTVTVVDGLNAQLALRLSAP